MIEHRNGDIFGFDDIDIIIHQANCFNVMGAGIAKVISEKYPEAVQADNRTIKGDKSKLGTFTSSGPCSDNKIIINMYGQYSYGGRKCHTDYDAIEKALEEFIEDYESVCCVTDIPLRVAVPYGMGCGLGGGDWKRVSAILNKLFEVRKEFTLIICKNI